MFSSSFAFIFAQATNAASAATTAAATTGTDTSAQQGPPGWTTLLYIPLFIAMIYFGLLRPQMQNKKKQEETIKGSKTGDKIVTSSGIHGVITNVKDSTVIVRVADNVKLEIEKSHIDKVLRTESESDKPEKIASAKA